jgi:tRNA threonylcarbamoyladenosine biosynthesis protein TsaB
MGEAYAARYRWRAVDGSWQVVEAPALRDPVVLAAQLAAERGPVQVAGSSLRAHAPAWAALERPAWPDAVAHGVALLALGRAAWRRGEAVDAFEAQPLYVRDKVAQTIAERAAVQATR